LANSIGLTGFDPPSPQRPWRELNGASGKALTEKWVRLAKFHSFEMIGLRQSV